LADFGFFCSRLLRFCPLAMTFFPYSVSPFRRVGLRGTGFKRADRVFRRRR
jgi:hypothetical protein